MIGLVAVLDIESKEFALEPWMERETPERHLVKISLHPTTHKEGLDLEDPSDFEMMVKRCEVCKRVCPND